MHLNEIKAHPDIKNVPKQQQTHAFIQNQHEFNVNNIFQQLQYAVKQYRT